MNAVSTKIQTDELTTALVVALPTPWVPPEVREKMMMIFKQNLAPCGVCYVSYNAHPFSHLRDMVRDMMQYHTRRLTSMHDAVQAFMARVAENVLKQFGRIVGFIAAQANADASKVGKARGKARDFLGGFRAKIARQIHNEANPRPTVDGAIAGGVVHQIHALFQIQRRIEKAPHRWRNEDFGILHVVRLGIFGVFAQ